MNPKPLCESEKTKIRIDIPLFMFFSVYHIFFRNSIPEHVLFNLFTFGMHPAYTKQKDNDLTGGVFMAQNNGFDTFSMEQVMAFAASPAGKQLIAMLRSSGTDLSKAQA